MCTAHTHSTYTAQQTSIRKVTRVLCLCFAQVTAMRSGHMFLLDELSLAEDAVLERLNSVLEPSRRLTLAEQGGAEVRFAVLQGPTYVQLPVSPCTGVADAMPYVLGVALCGWIGHGGARRAGLLVCCDDEPWWGFRQA